MDPIETTFDQEPVSTSGETISANPASSADTGLNSVLSVSTAEAQSFLDQVNALQTDLQAQLEISEMFLALAQKQVADLMKERDSFQEQLVACTDEDPEPILAQADMEDCMAGIGPC